MDGLPLKVVVEVVTPEVVSRLEAENQELREEVKLLRGQHERLHQTVYRLMDVFNDFKRSIDKKR